MKTNMKISSSVIIVASIILLGGCNTTPGSVSVHGSVSYGYGGYYDPHHHWGHGGDTTVIITNPRPDEPDRTRPERPVAKPKPPGGIGRPAPRRR